MESRLLHVDDPAWTAFLGAARHDFYHLPAYVGLSARHEGGDPAAILVTEGDRALLQPIIIRPIPAGGHDATSPYGYPGPLLRGTVDPRFASAALAAGVALLRSRGIVSLFVRLHPLINEHPPAGIGTLVRGGDTVSIDLTQPVEEQWRQTRGNHRVHINRAQRSGRVARFDDEWAHADDFKRLYRGTMARVSATPYYFFSNQYFEGLRAALGERMRLSIVEADGVVAAAALFVETSGIVQYHLSGTSPAYAREGLTKVLIDSVRRWATERGDQALHLGGGLSSRPDDPLFHFKAGFSERRHQFHTLRVIVDPDAYAALSRARDAEAARASAAGDDQRASTYFPAYRRPLDAGRAAPDAPGALVARPVTPDDAAALGELLEHIDQRFFRPHEMSAAEADRIVRLEGRDVYLIGFDGQEAVAYGMLRGLDAGYPTPSVGVGVRTGRRGEGFGRAMMLALHDAARGAGATSVRLRVHPDNHVAQRLYESLGYERAGIERDEVLMVRTIP